MIDKIMEMNKTNNLESDNINSYGTIPYRPGVGIMLLNRDRKIFVAQRIDKTSEAWQMPQGGINRDESPEQAAIRELKEETDINNASIIRQTDDWFFYDFPNELAAKLWRGKFRGQKQKWFAMQFLGHDDDINLNTDKPEFSDWRWVSSEEIPNMIVDFKRQLYRAVLDEFKDLL